MTYNINDMACTSHYPLLDILTVPFPVMCFYISSTQTQTCKLGVWGEGMAPNLVRHLTV